MLLKEEFTTNLSFLSPSINSMILAAEGEFEKLQLLINFNLFFLQRRESLVPP